MERFWSKVDKRGPGECWEWKASRHPFGYGHFRLGGKVVNAHRVAFMLANGKWPEPFCCHRCDNPACVNPAHLFEGTHADNMADMVAKGRLRQEGRPGTANPNAKLTEQGVRDIRANWVLCRTTYDELAERFGVNRTTIHRVVERIDWRHI